MTTLSVKESCNNPLATPEDGYSWQGDSFFDIFGEIAIILSWLTNVIATAAISYKAW